MIPEVNLAYVFSFPIKYKFYYFVTETTDGNDVNDDVDAQLDFTSSSDSDDDVQIGKFCLFPTNCFYKPATKIPSVLTLVY